MLPHPKINFPAHQEKLHTGRLSAANDYSNALLSLGVVAPATCPIAGACSFGDCTDWVGNTQQVREAVRKVFLFLSDRGQTFAEYRRERALAQPKTGEVRDPVIAFHQLIYDTVFFQAMDPGGNGDVLLEQIDYKLKEYNAKRSQGFGIAS